MWKILLTALVCFVLQIFVRDLIESRYQPSEESKITNPNLIRDFSPETMASRKFRPSLPAQALTKLSFGYTMLVADFLWLRFIQGMDELVVDTRNKGWLYQIVNGAVTLDPRFSIAYRAGGMWLSVIRQDVEGATDILERGASQFPHDWKMQMQLLYHHLWETEDLYRAREVAEHAASLVDAPPFMGRLVGTLLSRERRFEDAIEFLTRMVETAEDETSRDAYRERLQFTYVERDQVQLKELLNQHFKHWPTSWDVVIERGLLPTLPRDPKGDVYVIDSSARRILSKTIQVKSGLPSE